MSPASVARKKARARRAAFALPPAFNWSGLPYDLHVEIYGHLKPDELVNLARTNKEQHTSLRLRQCAVYWKRARDNADGLPPCPSWQTEMQFASFMYDASCTVCLKADASTRVPIWAFHVRYCFDCESKQTTTEDPFHGLPDGEYKTLDDIEDVLPCYYRMLVVDGEDVEETVFHLPDVLRFWERIMIAPEVARVDVVREFKAATTARQEHAELCEDWKDKMDKREADRIAQIVFMRYLDIRTKITEIGYLRELTTLGIQLEGLPADLRAFVDKPEPLSERDWERTLPRLKEVLEGRKVLENRQRDVDVKLIRLKNLDDALESYMLSHPHHDDDVWPCALDLMDLQVVMNFIDLDRDISIPPSSYINSVPSFVHDWRKFRESAVLALLPGIDTNTTFPQPTRSTITTRSMSPPPSPLSSQLALFWCTRCEELVSGLQAMQHQCCYPRDYEWHRLNPHSTPLIDGAYTPLVTEGVDMLNRIILVYTRGLEPWSPGVLRPCSDVVRSVWAAAGLDVVGPYNAKAESVRLACSACSVVDKIMVVMGWRRAVHHTFHVHDGQQVRWVKTCSKVSEKVQLVDYTDREQTAKDTRIRSRWHCQRCVWPQSRVSHSFLELVAHCNTEHFLLLPGGRRSLSLDSPEYMPTAVVLLETNLPDEDIPVFVDVVHRLRADYRVATMRVPKKAWAGMTSP